VAFPDRCKQGAEVKVRLLCLGGVAGPALFTAVVILCAALRPNYSHVAQFVSELGARGTSHAELMNLAGFVPNREIIGTAAHLILQRNLRFPLNLLTALRVSKVNRLATASNTRANAALEFPFHVFLTVKFHQRTRG
jgi:hypothetical protein